MKKWIFFVVILWNCPIAAMAQPANGTPLSGTEVFPIVTGSSAYKSATADDIQNFVNADASGGKITATGTLTERTAAWRASECNKNGAYCSVFNPLDFGAVCDGSTNDTAAWTALISAITSAGGGTVSQPACATIVDPGVIVLPSHTLLIGHGNDSIIKQSTTQSGTSFLISASGTGTGSHSQDIWIEDIQVNGGAAGGGSPLIQAYYASYLNIRNMTCNSANAGFLDAVELWDSRITDVQASFCGTTSSSATFHIRNSAAASGFGSSSDTSNQDFFTNIRVEDHFGFAFKLEQGVSNSNPPNGIYVTNFKAESHDMTNPSAVFYVGAGVNVSSFKNIYIALDSWFSGTSAVDGFYDNSGGGNVIDGVTVYQGTAGIVGSPINYASGSSDSISNVDFVSPAGAPVSNNVINVTGSGIPILGGYINSNPAIDQVAYYKYVTSNNMPGQIISGDSSSLGLPQFVIHGATTPEKLISMSFDTNANTGNIQAVWTGTAFEPLKLNPQGGTVVIGPDGLSANGTAGVSCAANTVSLTTLVVTNGIVTHC